MLFQVINAMECPVNEGDWKASVQIVDFASFCSI